MMPSCNSFDQHLPFPGPENFNSKKIQYTLILFYDLAHPSP